MTCEEFRNWYAGIGGQGHVPDAEVKAHLEGTWDGVIGVHSCQDCVEWVYKLEKRLRGPATLVSDLERRDRRRQMTADAPQYEDEYEDEPVQE